MIDLGPNVVRVEARVNGERVPSAVQFVVGHDHVTIVVAGHTTAVIDAPVWRLAVMHVATRAGALCRRRTDRG